MIFIFYGLSGAGKTYCSNYMKTLCPSSTYVIDNDSVRGLISPSLGFSEEDRKIHAYNIGAFLVNTHKRRPNNLIVANFILPLKIMRSIIKDILTSSGIPHQFMLIDTPLEECKNRDAKGLYSANTQFLPGIDIPFEYPGS